jgi:hypothetical protein
VVAAVLLVDDDDDVPSVLVCKKQTAAKAQPKISGPLATTVRTALVTCCATSSGLCSSTSCTKLSTSGVDIMANGPSWFDKRAPRVLLLPLLFLAMLIMRGRELLPDKDERSDNRCILVIMAPMLPLLLLPVAPLEFAVAPPRERCDIIIMGVVVVVVVVSKERPLPVSDRDHDVDRNDDDDDDALPFGPPPCLPHELDVRD